MVIIFLSAFLVNVHLPSVQVEVGRGAGGGGLGQAVAELRYIHVNSRLGSFILHLHGSKKQKLLQPKLVHRNRRDKNASVRRSCSLVAAAPLQLHGHGSTEVQNPPMKSFRLKPGLFRLLPVFNLANATYLFPRYLSITLRCVAAALGKCL